MGRGRLPRPPKVRREVVTLDEDPTDDDEAQANSWGLSKGGAEQLAWCERWMLPDEFRQVLNKKKAVVHLYRKGDSKTACGVMRSGSPEDPASNAVFVRRHVVRLERRGNGFRFLRQVLRLRGVCVFKAQFCPSP